MGKTYLPSWVKIERVIVESCLVPIDLNSKANIVSSRNQIDSKTRLPYLPHNQKVEKVKLKRVNHSLDLEAKRHLPTINI